MIGWCVVNVVRKWKKTNEFEKVFSEYVGTKYCIAVSSGTAALLVGLMALIYDDRFPKAQRGAKIITSPVTYISTASAIVLSGYEPVFVDIDKIKARTEDGILYVTLPRSKKSSGKVVEVV